MSPNPVASDSLGGPPPQPPTSAAADGAPPASPPRTARSGWFRRWAEALVVAFLVVTFVGTTVGIEGTSMAPSLLDGERALVPRYETWAVRFGLRTWSVGDVVYFRAPGDTPRTLLERITGGPFVIKRVVARGGQTLELRTGSVLVDDEPQPEPYLAERARASVSLTSVLVPEDHLFVLGDDRSPLGSRDSRAFGPVPVGTVQGRAAWVVWPPVRRDVDGSWRWNVRPIP